MQEASPERETPRPPSEDAYELSADLVKEISAAFEENRPESIQELVNALHVADLGELFNVIPPEHREALTKLISGKFNPEMLTYLNPEIRDEVIEWLGLQKSADAIATLETDDAIQVMEDLSVEEQQEILQAIPTEARDELKEGLAYPEHSAGRLMRKKLVTVPEYWNVGNTIDFLRKQENLPRDFYMIFVVDPKFHPIGDMPLSRIMRSPREMNVKTIMNPDVKSVSTDTDQEEVAYVFRKYGLAEIPVVNDTGRLVGGITVDDVVEVIQEESEEDLMRLGGVSHQDIHAGLLETVKSRVPWLLVNLLTATVASHVVSHFENMITQLVTLAVLMPMVASIGGNAGTQALTVTVRGIAERDLKITNAFRVVRKELGVALVNGLVLAILASAAVYFIFGIPILAAIFGMALILNLLVGGLAGSLIPILFNRMKIDPASASSIFVTMLTDTSGFFAFLGLAALMLK